MATDTEMLEELKKITALLTPKPAPPPPPPPKGFANEFIAFMKTGNLLAVAVAFVMGGLISNIVGALVSDLIMPVAGAFLPKGGWQTYTLTVPIGNGMAFTLGHFLSAVINFIIVAFVIFMIARWAKKAGVE
ncbi:MAG TPA: MscL family protein [Conexivisphaerales archaeon]|nr:MscL family protein [Conexivisphaerales archaeon]